ncbi:MAG: hypothetical protein COZ12_02830 [Deltaproteobacteria bacterium CG_4_10_14_3_um_filter_60_8]|nr:MAG: hypothetical protein AUK28_04495 [Desulfobacterales bacterium CG2_30_60_27]PIY22636.1 MAG: hypothetical protein COZ12_02830 [Deltaproteobacteria bacterium CG_4_10_14_3_um_filter_60_8]
MRLAINHLFLTAGVSRADSRQRVRRFLDRSILVRYATIEFLPGRTIHGDQAGFNKALEAGLARNRVTLAELISELDREGFRSLADLATTPQGYPSKLLHTIAHLVDGFFGIDSAFYNLYEDSHQVSAALRQAIRQQPAGFWLVELTGSSEVPDDDPVTRLRKFEAG